MFTRFNENIKQIYLASCLYDCIEDNNINAIESLLEKNCANPNIVLPDKGVSPFHLIVGYPDEATAEDVTKLFIRYGGDTNVRSEDNMTPVHVAAAWGRKSILNLLLKSGGDVTLRDDDNKTAYDYAIAEEHYSIATLLQRFHEDHEQSGYDLTLHKVIINDGVFVAEYDADKRTKVSIDYVSDYLSQLPTNELSSYVQNWCAKNMKIDNNKFNLEMYDNTDEFVTKRRKNRKFFSISNSVVDEPNDLIENMTQTLNNLDFEEKIDIFDKALGCNRNNNVINLIESPERNKYVIEEKIITDESKHSNISEESGLCAIPSDSSVFANPLEPLYDCKFIGEVEPNQTESSEYATCEDFNMIDPHEKNIDDDSSIFNKTYSITNTTEKHESVKKENLNVTHQIPGSFHFENETLLSVAEEYKYMDEEEGIVLIERRYLVTPQLLNDSKSSNSIANTSSSLPTTIDYDTETLRKELTFRGEHPGPITSTTKRVYLKRLMRLQKTPKENFPCPESTNRVYSIELEKTLRNPNWTDDLSVYKELESAVVKQFNEVDPSKKWREGVSKASFTYLLMDPRITRNLPLRAENLSVEELWKTFLSSIFYVGKGKRSRPYCHLYEAITHWNADSDRRPSKKTKHILDIWEEGKGVVCLHIFQNVIPVEAYTREAAIISALKLQNLKNAKVGDFYGVAATWSQRQKKLLGVYLLYRALYIFLNEGERQLRPDDI